MKQNSINFIKDSFVVLIVRIFGLLFQIAMFTLIARTHSLYEVGVYAFVNTVWAIARTLGPLGYDQAAMRFIPEYISQNNQNLIRCFIRHANQRIGSIVLLLSLLIASISLIACLYDKNYITNCISALILAFGLPAYAAIGFDVCLLRGFGDVVKAQIPESVFLPIFIGLGIGSTIFAQSVSIYSTLIIHVFSAWSIVAIYRIVQRFRLLEFSSANRSQADFVTVDIMASSSFRGMIATALAGRLPVILLPLFVGSYFVGLFEGALRLGILGTIPVWAIGVVASPVIARAYFESDFKTIDNLYTAAGILQTLPSILILIVIAFFGDFILGSLFGEDYISMHMVTTIIALSTAINAAGSAASSYLLMTGGERLVQQYSIASLFVVLIGVPTGAYVAGLEGVAWALVLKSFVRDIGLTIIVAKNKNLSPGLLSLKQLNALYNLLLKDAFGKIMKG